MNSGASSSGENIQEYTKTRTTKMQRGKMYTVIIRKLLFIAGRLDGSSD